MALPGTPGQRISDLCNGNHITQKELAEKIGVSASRFAADNAAQLGSGNAYLLRKFLLVRVGYIVLSCHDIQYLDWT